MSSAAQYASPSASRQTRGGRGVTTDIPARLDRLPWSRFHLLVIIAPGGPRVIAAYIGTAAALR